MKAKRDVSTTRSTPGSFPPVAVTWTNIMALTYKQDSLISHYNKLLQFE